MSISFLSTRVGKCNEKDYGKLRRLVNYTHTTLDEESVIGIEDIGIMHTYVDASYAVQPNMRSHSGGEISYGIGLIASTSQKQKLNVRSSTEAEIVGVSDVLPKVLHIDLFLAAQGHPLKENILYQDNKSAVKLEVNGKHSSSKRTRHVDIRYFYIKCLADKEKILIKYCPTEKMIADFFTKPLQGNLFRVMRKIILGHKPLSYLNETIMTSSKERDRESENERME